MFYDIGKKLVGFFAFFEKPENSKKINTAAFTVLVILIITSFFVHGHPYFEWEAIPGFYAVSGIIATVFIVIVAKGIGKLWLQKKEDYYD